MRTPWRALLPVLSSAAAAGVLFAASWAGSRALGGAVLALQLLLTLAWLAVLDAPGGTGGVLVAGGAAAAADALLLENPAAGVGPLVAVTGVAMVAGLAHQLLRRRRPRLTLSLAAVVSATVVGVAAAALVALRVGPNGRGGVAAAVAGAGAALLVARVVDALLARPRAVPAGRRGWPGLLAGAAAAYGAGLLLARTVGGLPPARSWQLALVAGGVALAVDLVADAGAGQLLTGADERRAAAVAPTLAFLPLALAAPAVYVAGRILLG